MKLQDQEDMMNQPPMLNQQQPMARTPSPKPAKEKPPVVVKKALVTGSSSGLGYQLARELARQGYDVTGVSRHEGDFAKLKQEFPKRTFTYIAKDLSKAEDCKSLLAETANQRFDFFCSNAGFGTLNSFMDADMDKETDMTRLNVIATQILVNEFVRRFTKQGYGKFAKDQYGRILVTASAAAFAPAPYMSAYFASKAYVYFLCLGYWRELKDMKSKCRLSVLCPGPVQTNFGKESKMQTKMHVSSADKVAKYAIKKAMKGKTTIVPTFSMKFVHFITHLFPKKWITWANKRAITKAK